MIIVFGSINMDLVAKVRSIARPGETVLSRRAESLFGGKGANQAVAAARAGSIPVAMVSAVGNDPFGRACLDNLKSHGIDVAGVRISDEPTGCAFIAVDAAGENAITVASGANMTVRSSDLTDDILAKASALVLQAEVPLAESLDAATRVKRAGVKVLWNAAPAPENAERDTIQKLLAVTDVLVVNEHEALAIAAAVGEGSGDDYRLAARAIAGSFSTICIVTAGAGGAYAMLPDGTQIHAPTRPIEPVDTTGAGDTFVGVFAAELAARLPIELAMKRSCAAASLACLAAGAQAGMPTRAALERFLAQA